ncbi:hypothetical protein CK203_027660 [Vitis vinifera]|uniref:Uncharacterized protein n=1 Tax=Vitis vinifera TaxID=29760 RepID=A0A438IH11_VITVI|nr:hypothetical protein CK203_027660 [Vitis vinifera]
MTRARGTSPDSELGIDGRGKLGYLMGEVHKLVKGDPNFRTWGSKNSLVTAWLLNSMKPFIVKPNMFLPIAQNVWDSENPNDCARRRILGRKPLQSIREVFSKVRQEECRKRIMFSNPELTLKTEPIGSALASRGLDLEGDRRKKTLELDSRSMIGSARECGGLYFFEDGMNSTSPEYLF